MYINLKKTLAAISRCLPAEDEPTQKQLHRMYELTQRLMSQELGVIYDREAFGIPEGCCLAQRQASGSNVSELFSLTIRETLPTMKKLTEAVEEHWKAMIHAAIAEAARQGPLPYYEKAFVAIEVITPRGSNNAQVWDTSNRAIQVILNNLKGIFFHDDDMEHMAFGVAGEWGEKGATTIHILSFEQIKAIWNRLFWGKKSANL